MLRKKTGKGKAKISFHELSDEELSKALRDCKNELRELRFSKVTSTIANPKRFGQLKKDVARILTVQTQRSKEAKA